MGLLGKLFGSRKMDAIDVRHEKQSSNKEAVELAQDKATNLQADTLKFDALRASRIGELTFAINAFRKSLQLRSEFETRFYLVDALISTNQNEEALYEMDLLLQEIPSHRATLTRRASLLLQEGYTQEALSDIELALATEVESEDEWIALIILQTRVLEEANRIDEALVVIEELLQRQRESGQGLLLKSRILHKLGRLDEAEETLECAAQLMPEEEQVSLRLGQIALERGQIQQAIHFGHQAIALDPFNIQARILISNALCLHDKKGEAISFIQSAIEELGEKRILLLLLVELYQQTGASSRAAELRGRLPEEESCNDQVAKLDFGKLYAGGIY